MTPYYADDWLTVYAGDCRAVLPPLPAESVDCIVTSPPYWGLRDYGTEGQLGLEPTPELYVANLVGVFRDLRRVLKPSGTCWLNLGDSYAHNTREYPPNRGIAAAQERLDGNKRNPANSRRQNGDIKGYSERDLGVIKPKDLVGIPWRVAFALQADGWYLRSDIIWSKPNPMPESVTDRPTKAHEYLFLLTKSARYFYDADAVRESGQSLARTPGNRDGHQLQPGNTDQFRDSNERVWGESYSRNLRSVWTIATRPYPGAHFAVFPPELPERCIKAGSPDGGVILDPFAGSGTVGLVANRLSRRAILIDLNPDYISQQMKRNAQTPLGLPA